MAEIGHETGRLPTLSETDFIEGLLAAMSKTGIGRIKSHPNDAHQVAFRNAVNELERRRALQDPATQRMPWLFPGPITGKYSELDSALISLQSIGITRVTRPYFDIDICPSPELTEEILEKFTVEERVLLNDLGQIIDGKVVMPTE